MKKIIDFSIKHPVSILSIITAVVLLGIMSTFIIPIDFLPIISSRKLIIAAEYEGISAQEMRSMVTIPLEDAFASLKGLKTSEAVTRDGLSLLSIELHWGTDIDMALVESREIIDLCYETLPSRCKKPIVIKDDSVTQDTIMIAVIPLDGDLQYGRYIAETDIKPRFQRLTGVGSVSINGGEKEQIQVQLKKDILESKQLTVQNISDVLARSNFEYPAGNILEGEKELAVKTSGLYTSIDDIGNTPISYSNGGLLRISDIADVVRTTEKKQSFFLYNGLECIKISIQKKTDSSPLLISSLAKNEIKKLELMYGSWLRFEVLEDMSVQILNSISALLLSAILGIIITGFIIQLFFKSIKLSLLISSVIPISAAVAILILNLTGKTLNTMSLSGISIGIGLVVDNSTIVIENILKKIKNITKQDNNLHQIISSSTKGVTLSNSSSAVTTIIVFIPFFFIKGLLGELFVDMAIAIITSITTSCILSFTYIPAIMTFITPKLKKQKKSDNILHYLENKYEKLLSRLFKYPIFALLGVLFCLGIGFISFINIEYKLLPDISIQTIKAEIPFPTGTSIQAMENIARDIYSRLSHETYITSIHLTGGIEQNDYKAFSNPTAQNEKITMTIYFTIQSDEVQSKISNLFNGTRYAIYFGEQKDMLSTLLDIQTSTTIITGDTPEDVREKIENLKDQNIEVIPDIRVTESIFTPDRLAGARFSVTAQYTAAIARNTLEGTYSVPFYEKGREIPVLVKIRDSDIQSLYDLENTNISLENSSIPLRILGTISEKSNEKVLYRFNRKDAKQLLNLSNLKHFTNNTENNFEFPGKQELKEMTNSSFYLLLITILLLYLIMGAQFESFIIPLLLLCALPPAFSGSFLFLAIFGKSININSIIALVVLFGTSVNNSIILYEGCIINKKITIQSIINSSKEKLRAIFITNMTTICALIPFAVDPHNTSAQSSMALAIIGGLIVSVILVLGVIPILFSYTLPKRNFK